MRIGRIIPPFAVMSASVLGAAGLSGGCSTGVQEGEQSTSQ